MADLAAASILFHLADPPEFQYVIPEFPRACYEFRDSTAPPESLEWIRRMWREHRPASAEIAAA